MVHKRKKMTTGKSGWRESDVFHMLRKKGFESDIESMKEAKNMILIWSFLYIKFLFLIRDFKIINIDMNKKIINESAHLLIERNEK